MCSVTVAFEESVESLELDDLRSSAICLSKMANDVTYRRLLQALQRIQTTTSCQLLSNILLGIRQRAVPPWLNVNYRYRIRLLLFENSSVF